MTPWVVVDYDTVAYPFADRMLDVLGIRDFADLPSADRIGEAEAARRNAGYRAMLKQLPLDGPLLRLYGAFMQEFATSHFGARLSYTQRPVLRVQLAGSPSISSAHRDADYTGRWDYVNGWLPMLDTAEGSALRVETGYGTGQLAPIPLRYGQVLFFDAGMLEHGSTANTSDRPRVSMDFRFVARGRTELRDRILGQRPEALVEASVAAHRAAGAAQPMPLG